MTASSIKTIPNRLAKSVSIKANIASLNKPPLNKDKKVTNAKI